MFSLNFGTIYLCEFFMLVEGVRSDEGRQLCVMKETLCMLTCSSKTHQ
jgi:hypothetical protein